MKRILKNEQVFYADFQQRGRFNEYFKRENELCDKYAKEDGALHFESDADFENLIRQLMPEYEHSFIYE